VSGTVATELALALIVTVIVFGAVCR